MKVTLYDGNVIMQEYNDITNFPDISGVDTSKTGYTFNGWFEDAELTVANTWSVGDELTADVNLYAKYTGQTKTITYLNMSGTEIEGLSPTTFTVGTGVAASDLPDLPAAPTGYEVGLTTGWYIGETRVSGDSGIGIGTDVVTDVILVSKYDIKVYSITYYDTLSGTNPNPTQFDIQSGVVTLQSSSKSGFVFDGWYSGSAGTGNKITSVSVLGGSVDTVVYANWKLDITFNVSNITVKKLSGASYVDVETPIHTNVDSWDELETLYLFCGENMTFADGVKVTGIKKAVESSVISIDEDKDIATLNFAGISALSNITNSTINFTATGKNSYVSVVVFVDGEKEDKLTKIGLPVDTAYSFEVIAKPGYKIESSGVITGGVPKTVTFNSTTRTASITVGGKDTGVINDFIVSISQALDTSLTYQSLSCFNNSFSIESKLIEIGNNSSYNSYSVFDIIESPNGYATIILKKNSN